MVVGDANSLERPTTTDRLQSVQFSVATNGRFTVAPNNLRIKSFVGTSRNAVMTQIWIAMCVHLLLAYLKFVNKMSWTMSEILRLLQLNLFARRPLLDLFEPRSRPPDPRNPQTQLALR